jgi:hypothetical protein
MQVLQTHTYFHNNLPQSASWLPSSGPLPQSASGMDAQELREFMDQYVSELADLTFNSKPIINTLTMLASENVKAASSIAAAVEKHIYNVRPCNSSAIFFSSCLHLKHSYCAFSVSTTCLQSSTTVWVSYNFVVVQCSAAYKLYGLYLMDSIIKNVRQPYTSLFSRNLPEVCVRLFRLHHTIEVSAPLYALQAIHANLSACKL